LTTADHWGTFGARVGFRRNDYKVTPGLYCLGDPDSQSPVLVTGNYKLTVDSLRIELSNTRAWLLVVDTRGINVWCAAGKGTFSAHEVAYQVQQARLNELVDHRKLILPQLAANGINHREIKRLCGFAATFGPIRAADLEQFLETGKADEAMRTVSFTIKERLVLIPVEIFQMLKPLLAIAVVLYFLSGISPDGFSLNAAIARGNRLLLATLAALLSGAVLTPLLLPWIPVRSFWAKGALVGGTASLIATIAGPAGTVLLQEQAALFCWMVCVSSYLAMNFTGSTPFTSFAGVVREMRRGLKVQLLTLIGGVILWLTTPFMH